MSKPASNVVEKVIAYHIHDKTTDLQDVPPSILEDMLESIKKKTYNSVSLAKLYERVHGERFQDDIEMEEHLEKFKQELKTTLQSV